VFGNTISSILKSHFQTQITQLHFFLKTTFFFKFSVKLFIS